jgi:hypothetical protein
MGCSDDLDRNHRVAAHQEMPSISLKLSGTLHAEFNGVLPAGEASGGSVRRNLR